ncbi:hypothetical protein CONLIGDRAFT_467118 [Coniochaeta ligniaria NRRL 30616]|uniref:Uncharacterized protein n=1 Tax=Coniochaeta ligniaria NRRL 30616 TaxID=1408157 RepID=A0A1J7IFK9_9PEZI|nr:hypothetical protein CONLIGDRAFT_467118 [Coniochaeta ligniaria NRRL 30616]
MRCKWAVEMHLTNTDPANIPSLRPAVNRGSQMRWNLVDGVSLPCSRGGTGKGIHLPDPAKTTPQIGPEGRWQASELVARSPVRLSSDQEEAIFRLRRMWSSNTSHYTLTCSLQWSARVMHGLFGPDDGYQGGCSDDFGASYPHYGMAFRGS